jgi:hypothetical protein
MVSASPSDRFNFRNSSSSQQHYGSGQVDNWESKANSDQMFQLIDTLLPFEACLYHQVLPLSIEKTNLHLGMVSPDDMIALEYVRRILAYVNYSLVTHRLPNDIHQHMLSAYLNYAEQRGSLKQPGKAKQYRPLRKVIEPETAEFRKELAPDSLPPTSAQPFPPSAPQVDHNLTSDPTPGKTTQASGKEDIAPAPSNSTPSANTSTTPTKAVPRSFYQDDQATLITDIQDELLSLNDQPNQAVQSLSANPSAPPFQPSNNASASTTPAPHSAPNLSVPAALNELPNELPSALSSPISDVSPSVLPQVVLPPTLELNPNPKYLQRPITELVTLSAPELVAQLLARVLGGGIGRLFFEQQQTQGRILWSQNGVLQATLEELPIEQMQAIVLELKHLSGLGAEPISQAQQVEVERIYQNARLLLRFRFMPGIYGEEATLQVLRGAALKFHQQQQPVNNRELFSFANHLQSKVDELLEQAQVDPSVVTDDTLSSLRSVLMSLGEKLRRLEALSQQRQER